MKLNTLPKITARKHKRLGQGHGSGKGKTAGRGTKGQGARGKVTYTFSAGSLAFVKRLPLVRGKYRNKPRTQKPFVINVKYLNILPAHTVVDKESLIKYQIINENTVEGTNIKILGDGELKVPLIVKLPCSKHAAKKITASGGKIEIAVRNE